MMEVNPLPVTWTRLHRDFGLQYQEMTRSANDADWNNRMRKLAIGLLHIGRIGGFAAEAADNTMLGAAERRLHELRRRMAAEKEFPGYAARLAEDAKISYGVGSECIAFMREGDPCVRKFYGKDLGGCVAFSVKLIRQHGDEIMLKIGRGTPEELRARMALGKCWPGLVGGEFSEHGTYCEVSQRRGAGERGDALLAEWRQQHAGMKLPCISMARSTKELAERSTLSIRPDNGQLVLLSDVHELNVDRFDGAAGCFDFVPTPVTGEIICEVKPLARAVGALMEKLRGESRPMELAPQLALALRDSGGGLEMGRRDFMAATLGLSAGLTATRREKMSRGGGIKPR